MERLHETFVRLCEIRSPTGEEREVADSVAAELRALGLEVSEDEGLVCGGTSPDDRLVEMVELPDHPFFIASQFHPEFNSRPNRPEPLFRELIGAAARHAGERPAGEVEPAESEDVAESDVGARHSG